MGYIGIYDCGVLYQTRVAFSEIGYEEAVNNLGMGIFVHILSSSDTYGENNST